MVTSDGLISVNPMLCQQGFNLFPPDTFSHENDLLTIALHTTVTSSSSSTPIPSSFFDSSAASLPSSSTPSLSSTNSVGSDPLIIGSKRKRNCHFTQGKTTKRRSRPSRKPQITFITADPSNFRQMVHQVTGAKSVDDTSFETFISNLTPNLNNRLITSDSSNRSTSFAMLDTSVFLSNYQPENLALRNAYSGISGVRLPSVKPNAAANEGGSSAEFDNYPIFPTLESWNVT